MWVSVLKKCSVVRGGEDCSILRELLLSFFLQGVSDRFPNSVEGESALPVSGVQLDLCHYTYKLVCVFGFLGRILVLFRRI
jgi:hypothetical protein